MYKKRRHAFKFKKDKRTYDVTIPYNNALADISVIKPSGTNVSISSPVISDSGVGTITVTYTDNNEKSTVYTIHVKREAEPRFDTNCRLSTLEIEGFRLDPSFDPDVFLYNITVPYGTESINVYCTAQNPTAQVIIGDTMLYGDETSVIITVGTPDGETLRYIIRVSRLPMEESTISDGNDDDSSKGISRRTLIIIIIGIVAASILVPIYLKFAKHDEEIKQNEENHEASNNDQTE